MIRRRHKGIRPQDIVILLKILLLKSDSWYIQDLSHSLKISLSEVSESLERSRFSGLINQSKKKVNRTALNNLLIFGIRFVFPEKPGALVKGIPTAHSFPRFANVFESNIQYVWQDDNGTIIGQEIEPFYKNQVFAVMQDEGLYEILALIDLIRIGNKRELNFAVENLSSFILDEKLDKCNITTT